MLPPREWGVALSRRIATCDHLRGCCRCGRRRPGYSDLSRTEREARISIGLDRDLLIGSPIELSIAIGFPTIAVVNSRAISIESETNFRPSPQDRSLNHHSVAHHSKGRPRDTLANFDHPLELLSIGIG